MKISGRLTGYVRAEAGGGDVTTLLNHLSAADIPLWDVIFSGENAAFSLPARDLKTLRRLAQSSNIHVVVGGGGGFPFWRRKIRRRRLSLVCAAMILILLTAAASLICRIEVTGEYGTTLTPQLTAEIRETATANGAGLFSPKATVDRKAVAAAIIAACPELSWVGLDFNGVTLTIRCVGRIRGPNAATGNGDVVAEKDGVITKILVLQGQALSAVGDTVQKGDVLISGTIVYEEEGKEPVYAETAAKGVVTATVWCEGSAYMSRRQVAYEETGATAGIITAGKEGKIYRLWGSEESPFTDFIVKEQKGHIRQWTWQIKTYCEATTKSRTLTQREAAKAAKDKAEKQAKAKLSADAKVTGRKVYALPEKKGAVGCRVVYETEEDIGVFHP